MRDRHLRTARSRRHEYHNETLPTHWSIDFGTSNTTVYHDRDGHPRVFRSRTLAKLEPITQTPVIPSVVCVLDPDAKDVRIGQEAINFNFDGQAPGFARSLKRYLDTEASRQVARVGGNSFNVQELVSLYFRELIDELEEESGERVNDLTLTVPTDYYETYRRNLGDAVRTSRKLTWFKRVLAALGMKRHKLNLRFLDEPVAAALGYGVSLEGDRTVVSVDFGAGTMEMACIRNEPGTTLATGHAQVLGKQALRMGGDNVDQWIIEKFAPENLQKLREWRVALQWEAERAKLMASANKDTIFTFRNKQYGELTHSGLLELMESHGLFDRVRDLAETFGRELQERAGISLHDVDEVLLEGGSTLLPGFRPTIGEIFGLDKVREWLPFESVARGACIFGGGLEIEDYIHHDYALRILSEDGDQVAYELLIPRGTRYPTQSDFVTRYYSANRNGQSELSLYICEVGRVAGRPVDWDRQGDGSFRFLPTSAEERAYTICLNEQSAPLPLNPPGRGTGPRLRVTYNVNEDRWLCVTVHDLVRKLDLKADEAVVKLR